MDNTLHQRKQGAQLKPKVIFEAIIVILAIFHGYVCAAERPNVLFLTSDDLNN